MLAINADFVNFNTLAYVIYLRTYLLNLLFFFIHILLAYLLYNDLSRQFYTIITQK